jgi:hypothetical protein
MSHLGALNFISAKREKTTEERFIEHVMDILRRGHLLTKSHGKYTYFDSFAKQEAPKFGLELKNGHWVTVA